MPEGAQLVHTSILIAKLIGPILVVAGLATLFNPKAFHEMGREFLESRALIFIAGFLSLLGGLVIVNFHNLWIAGWPVIITIFGWMAIIGGILRMAFPALTKSIGEAMLARKTMLRAAAGIWALLGAYLMIMSYL